MQTLLKVRGLGKHFTLHEQGKRIASCSNVSLDVNVGQLTALTGQTGCGKSSVLKCVYRTYLASSGEILYTSGDGTVTDLVSADESRILALRRSDIGFVTQFLHCLPRRSALELVMDPLLLRGTSVELARERASQMLTQLDIRPQLWAVPPATFSGGEKQRINLARCLVTKPRLLLLDEPTASLDRNTSARVVDLLKTLKGEGVAMLAVFHDPLLVEQLADQHLALNHHASDSLTCEVSEQ
jgi:alpha-D-ribose 1-methylphosphonate 5-triphosphate synthase subunit PhnL